MTAKALRVAGIMMLALALAGCGKKGAPMPPPGVANVFPRSYPSDQATPSPAADRDRFPSLDQPNTNIDPTKPRTIGQPGGLE